MLCRQIFTVARVCFRELCGFDDGKKYNNNVNKFVKTVQNGFMAVWR